MSDSNVPDGTEGSVDASVTEKRVCWRRASGFKSYPPQGSVLVAVRTSLTNFGRLKLFELLIAGRKSTMEKREMSSHAEITFGIPWRLRRTGIWLEAVRFCKNAVLAFKSHSNATRPRVTRKMNARSSTSSPSAVCVVSSYSGSRSHHSRS